MNALREAIWAIIGFVLLIASIGLKLEWYYVALSAGLMVWGIYDFIKEIRDKDVDKSASERKRIADKMKE